MLGSYGFNEAQKAEVLDYVKDHSKVLRELSLRMVLKIADLRKAMPNNWVKFVEKNCHRKVA